MIPSRVMTATKHILLIAGPTASGKTSRAVDEALACNGEIISVDSRQVYRTLDIGTEKISPEEMCGVPHHLIDIRDPEETYSAGDFVHDATRIIDDIRTRGKFPILAGGTHFYFDALLHGLPDVVPTDIPFRESLDSLPTEELHEQVLNQDPERAAMLDPKNRRRLLRAIEILRSVGKVSKRVPQNTYEAEWIVLNPPKEELVPRIEKRLNEALEKGLVEEVRRVRERVGDKRLNELGLEYRIVGEYLRGERDENTLLPTLNAKLWQYARHQKKWLRKLLQASAG